MRLTKSLRGRLGLLFSAATFVLMSTAVLAIGIGTWRQDIAELPESVDFTGFSLAGRSTPENLSVDDVIGADAFAIAYDDDGQVIASTGAVDQGLLGFLADSLVPEVQESGISYSLYLSDDEDGLILIEGGFFDESDFFEETPVDGFWDESVLPHVIADGGTAYLSAVRCSVQTRCDLVVVGSIEESLGEYFLRNWAAFLLPPLAAAALAMAGSWWLVGHSLRPVELMRAELDTITGSDLQRRVPVPNTGDELQDLGTSMNHTIARLEASAAANERFVADAAHELRSPITGVKAALEVEAMRSSNGLIQDSLGELERASRLIDDLLVLARRQGIEPSRTDVDLDDIVRSEVTLVRSRFPDITIAAELQPVRYRGDGDALRRVVANLVENACLYGKSRVEISLSAPETGDHGADVLLIIDDDGHGVPPSERDRIFERFARVDESRNRDTGGSGLGLAIAAETIADHGGTITVTDAPGGGARLTVELPSSTW